MTADVPSTVPSTREFSMLGITYGLYALGLVIIWPAAIGLVVAYVKRGDVAGSFLASHYSWLIRTFWGWAIGFLLGLAALLALVLPPALEIDRTATKPSIQLPWELLGGAVGGGLVIAAVWCWVVYRLIRGTLRLADARAVP
jgi:uncharacterized membrane protein